MTRKYGPEFPQPFSSAKKVKAGKKVKSIDVYEDKVKPLERAAKKVKKDGD